MKIRYIVLVVVCIMIGFSSGYFFRDTIPAAEVIEQSSSYEVYEEFAPNHLLEIYVNTVNVNLRVLPSHNRNIRMVYRPSMEPSNYEYYIENKIMYMTIDEVEKSNSIVPSNREMIYLYLPDKTDVSLHFMSESGFVDVDQVDLRNLFVDTKSGIVSLDQVDVALDLHVHTVSGKVIAKDLMFSNVSITTNTALVSCNLDDVSLYDVMLSSKEGTILVNTKEYTEYKQESDEDQMIMIDTRSGDIRIKMKEINEDETGIDV